MWWRRLRCFSWNKEHVKLVVAYLRYFVRISRKWSISHLFSCRCILFCAHSCHRSSSHCWWVWTGSLHHNSHLGYLREQVWSRWFFSTIKTITFSFHTSPRVWLLTDRCSSGCIWTESHPSTPSLLPWQSHDLPSTERSQWDSAGSLLTGNNITLRL